MAEQRDFNAELKQVQVKVKDLSTQRDRLNREAGVEEGRRDEALKKLRELGVKKPEALTVEGLGQLRDQSRAELITRLDAIKAKVAEGDKLMADYEKAIA
jgi:hypothetical protein